MWMGIAVGCGDGSDDVIAPVAPSGATSGPAQSPPASPPPSPREHDPSGYAQPDDPTVASFLGLTAPKPAEWELRPPQNQMVHTNYLVPGADGGNDAYITLFFFGAGMGGPIQDNIDRWQGQFRAEDGSRPEPDVSELDVDGMNVTFVELAGAYQGMGDPTHTPNQLLLAAIIDAPAGRLFLRFVGDEATIEHHRDAFMELVKGLQRANSAASEGSGGSY